MAFGSLIDRIVGFDREKEKQRELDFQRGMQPIYQKAAQRARAQYSAGKIPIQERDSRINRIVQENSPQAKLNWFDRANLRAANTVSENKILRPTLVGLAQLSPTKTLGNFTGYAGRAGSALGWDKGKYLAQAGDNIARYTQPDFQGNFASRGLGDSIVSGGIELLGDISNPVSMTLAPFKYGTQTANELARGMESTGRFSPAQSFAAGTGLGAVSAILERTGLDKITGGAGTRAVRRIATSGAVEGLTEGAQQLTSNIATNRLVDRNQGILQGVPQSLAAGAILGSGIKGGIEATAPKGLNDAQLQERYKWMNIYTKASDKGKTASMDFAARKIDAIDKQGASPLDKAISKVVKPVDAFDESKYLDPLESLKQEARKFETLPADIHPSLEAKAVGVKRIAPDRVPHQQLTPDDGIRRLVQNSKEMYDKRSAGWTKIAGDADALIKKYGDKMPLRRSVDLNKYPDFEKDMAMYNYLKKNTYGTTGGSISKMRDQFVSNAERTGWNATREAQAIKDAPKQYVEAVRKDISKGYRYPDEVLNYDPSFRKAIDSRARYEKGLYTSFSSDDHRIVFDEKNRIAGGMKRQDGKELTPSQKEEIVNGILQTQNVLGINLDQLAKDNRWVYAHLNGKNPFLTQNAAGLYRGGKDHASISVGGTETFKTIENGKQVTKRVNTTMAHELGHALDLSGDKRLFDREAIWKLKNSYNSTEGGFRGRSYWGNDKEVTARAIAQYVAYKEGHIDGLFDKPGNWDKNIFETIIAPEVERAIGAKYPQYKIAPQQNIVTQSQSPKSPQVDADEAFRQELRAQGMTVPDDYVQNKPTVTMDNLDRNRLKTDVEYQREVNDSMFAVGQPTKEALMKEYKKVFGNYDKPKQSPLTVEKKPVTPKTVRVFQKSKFRDSGAYVDVPVIRRVDNKTLYQGGSADGRQFWTENKKYAEQFGEVTEKTGSFYEVDNGNRVTTVYVEADKPNVTTPKQPKPTLQDALESKTAKIDKLETTTKLDGRIVSASENKNLSENIRRQLKDVNSVRKQIIDAEVEPLVELGKTSKNIINQIKAQGGISTSAYESIPKSVMNKQGMSADKMAQVLGYADEDALVEAIQSYSKPLSRAELRQQAIENLESGKSEYSADWKQTTDKANELLAEIQTLPIVRKKVKVIDNEPHTPSKEEIDSLLGTYKRTSIEKSDEGLQIVNEEINAESGTVKSKTVTQTSQPEVKDKIEGDFTESSNKYLGSLLNSETQARLYADKLPKLSKEKRIDAIKAIDAGKKTGDKEIDDYVKEFKKYTDNLYAKYKSQGVNMGYVDSYLPRIYKHPETGAPLTSQEFELLQLGSSRQKKRIAGELEAESLLYDKPEDLLAHYVKSMERTVAGKQYLSSLEKGGYITASSQRPKGLKLIDAEGFAEEGGLNLYAKPEIADALNRIFGSQSENKLLRGTARVASVAQDLGLSGGIPGTPANAFTFAQLTKEVLAGNIKGPAIALAKSFKKSSASKYFKENADTIAEMQKSGIALSTEYNMTSLRELAGDISDQDGKAARAWDRVMSDPTFRRFMPILQVEMYKTVKQHKNASVASQAVKNFYGLTDLVTQRTRSKNTNNAATALLFAPKYRESMVRFWVKNVQALNPKGAFKNARSGEYSQNLKFVAGATVLFGAMQAMNYALNGVPTWDNPDGKKDKLLIPGAPGVGGKTLGLPFLSSIATVPRNAGMAVYNAVTQNPDELKKNVKSFSSYLGRPFWDLMDNENYFGQRIVDDKASTAKRATQGASYLVESFQHPYVRESLNLAKNKLPESVQEFVGARDTTPLQSLSQALESPVRFYDPKYFKGGKNQPVKGQEDQRLQKKPNGKFTVTIGGEEKTFDSQEKAKKALSIDDFKNGADKVKEIDGKMYLKADNEQGYTTKSKSEYQFDKDMQGVDVAMDKAKESGDLKTWLTQAEKKYNALLKKRDSYDPETEFDKIDTINKQLLNIEQSYSKYAGYGGFKKGGSGKGRKKKYSFDVPSSFSLLPKTSSIGSVSNLLKNARVDYRA